MIEFKAECGHTVRAKDEDAGSVVRCSYCGRESGVPDNREDDLDFLFRDVQKSDDRKGSSSRRKRPKRKRIFAKRPARPGEFDPFAVVIRLCYAAALIIVVIFVGRKWIVPLFQQGGIAQQLIERRADSPAEPVQPVEKKAELPPAVGLISRSKPTGLYVASTPAGAAVYYMLESEAPGTGPIYRNELAAQFRSGESWSARGDGTYVVEVVLPVPDKNLKRYPGYTDFRRELMDASDKERRWLVNDYFLPDGAAVFIDEDKKDGQQYIVRQYRSVEVRRGKSKGVRALFLPRIATGDRRSFSIEELLQRSYIPGKKNYAFDVEDVQSELAFYDVPKSDWMLVTEALLRIGVVPYKTADGRIRLFQIDIHDGLFSPGIIREAGQ